MGRAWSGSNQVSPSGSAAFPGSEWSQVEAAAPLSEGLWVPLGAVWLFLALVFHWLSQLPLRLGSREPCTQCSCDVCRPFLLCNMQVINVFAVSRLYWMPLPTLLQLHSCRAGVCPPRIGQAWARRSFPEPGASLSLSELAGSVGAQVRVCLEISRHGPGAICPPTVFGDSPPLLLSYTSYTQL